jgi:hypothetical protein
MRDTGPSKSTMIIPLHELQSSYAQFSTVTFVFRFQG